MLHLLALLHLFGAAVSCASATGKLEYDYVIVGAGTCGLVVANRLSELENVSVLVIEAGDSVLNNTNVTDTNPFSFASLGTSIDWQYVTVSQTYADGRSQVMNAGKAIGGTSTINGMSYTRTQDAVIDSWQELGNAGWNWKSLFPYILKSEHYQIPSPAQTNVGASFNPAFHNYSGPLKVGFTNHLINNSISETFRTTFGNVGVPYRVDNAGGKMRGYNMFPKTIDRALNVREDAARAYYWPYVSRQNLKVLPNTTVTRVLWKETTSTYSGNLVASGVEIMSQDGTKKVVTAKEEVILSAGALKSPVLLELSGIGNPSILSKHNIPTKVPLPGVGEHLQDQTLVAMEYNTTNISYVGDAGYVSYISAHDIFTSITSTTSSSILSSIPAYASSIVASTNNTLPATSLEKAFRIQHSLIFSPDFPLVELLPSPVGTLYVTPNWNLFPFARGSVHLSSSDPTAMPLIDPRYFMFESDVQAQIAIAKFVRKVFSTAPLSASVGGEVAPGSATVPEDATDEVWSEWLKATYAPNRHPVSTAAMLPREDGGVVDAELRVYGTMNLRVVDASVLPTQLSGHLTSVLYGVAERAADIIKAHRSK